jgi:SAM-dependent methyltransferase
MLDVFGKALLDYQNGVYSEDIYTWTNISNKDVLPLPYLFRDYKDMPKLEQKALQSCQGNILDIGCGSGSHTLWLQNKGYEVKGIDISRGAVEVAKKRGAVNIELQSLSEETETFDTILLLMNGTGIFQELAQVSKYLLHLKTLLNPKGKILIDSSDISYMYEDNNGGTWLDLNNGYYGELDYYINYKGEEELPMKWLYLDFDTLKNSCTHAGLECTKVMDGEHFDYLAKITL